MIVGQLVPILKNIGIENPNLSIALTMDEPTCDMAIAIIAMKPAIFRRHDSKIALKGSLPGQYYNIENFERLLKDLAVALVPIKSDLSHVKTYFNVYDEFQKLFKSFDRIAEYISSKGVKRRNESINIRKTLMKWQKEMHPLSFKTERKLAHIVNDILKAFLAENMEAPNTVLANCTLELLRGPGKFPPHELPAHSSLRQKIAKMRKNSL